MPDRGLNNQAPINYDMPESLNPFLKQFGVQMPDQINPAVTLPGKFAQAHPRMAGAIDNALIALANYGQPSMSAAANVSQAARAIASINPTRRQFMMQQIQAPLELAGEVSKLQTGVAQQAHLQAQTALAEAQAAAQPELMAARQMAAEGQFWRGWGIQQENQTRMDVANINNQTRLALENQAAQHRQELEAYKHENQTLRSTNPAFVAMQAGEVGPDGKPTAAALQAQRAMHYLTQYNTAGAQIRSQTQKDVEQSKEEAAQALARERARLGVSQKYLAATDNDAKIRSLAQGITPSNRGGLTVEQYMGKIKAERQKHENFINSNGQAPQPGSSVETPLGPTPAPAGGPAPYSPTQLLPGSQPHSSLGPEGGTQRLNINPFAPANPQQAWQQGPGAAFQQQRQMGPRAQNEPMNIFSPQVAANPLAFMNHVGEQFPAIYQHLMSSFQDRMSGSQSNT